MSESSTEKAPFPSNPESYMNPLEVLDLSRLERNYLEVREAGETKENDKKLFDAIIELKTEIAGSRENIMKPEVNDRVIGLTWAYDDVSRFIADQDLHNAANFPEAIKQYANGLIDRKTQEYKNFRAQASGLSSRPSKIRIR